MTELYVPKAERLIRDAGLAPLPPAAANGTHPDIPVTGWERVDLSPWLDGDPPDENPKLGCRADGQAILYPGKVHCFNGEPESGKSWAAQHIAGQEVAAGWPVTYLDFEDGPGAVTARMLALGTDREAVRTLFHYHRLDQPFTLEASFVLDYALAQASPALTVLDGMTEAMNLCGLNPYDNSDVAKFWAMIPRRLARTGAAALLVDHVVKDAENRGRWAIGAQHKMAAVDGAAFTIEAVRPFGRGKEGQARLLITKDRPGYLRQHAVGSVIAEFKLVSRPDGTAEASLTGPVGHGENFRPTVLMERISAQLAHGPALTGRQVRAAVKGNTDAKDLALRLLTTEGYVQAVKQGPATYHSNLRPFPDPEPEDTEQHESF